MNSGQCHCHSGEWGEESEESPSQFRGGDGEAGGRTGEGRRGSGERRAESVERTPVTGEIDR